MNDIRLLSPLLLLLAVGCTGPKGEPATSDGGSTEPAAKRPASEPAASPSAEPAWTRVARELGVPRLTLEIEAGEVARQEGLGGKVGFEAALRAALKSVMEDGSNLESPLSLFRQGGKGMSEEQARARVREVLNQPTSRLGLVRLTPPASEDDPGYHLNRPEGGETAQPTWVLYLLIQETYDHAHWAVVPRDGGAVYNYGFN
ncbi:MAG: hypothetical protein AB7N76_35735 [Planctomycetota bacterium]